MRHALMSVTATAFAVTLLLASQTPAIAQSQWRDTIAELIEGRYQDAPPSVSQAGSQSRPKAQLGPRLAQNTQSAQPSGADKDPRSGDLNYEQAKRLMAAIDEILKDAAENRGKARKLPSKDEFLVPPLWTETREDRERYIRQLMDSALGIVTEVPIVEYQKTIEGHRETIRKLEDEIAMMQEKQLDAPKDGLLPGVLSETVDSLETGIAEARKRIERNKDEIARAKEKVRKALDKAGIKMAPDQVDLLLDGVLSGDLVRLVAIFNSAKIIDRQLARRMKIAGQNVKTARKYFAMHAALFAMLVHAQDTLIDKIDEQYLPKLSAIAGDIRSARKKTQQLLRQKNRPDQKRVLQSNLESQRLAEEAAKGYRRYLLQQREQIAAARSRAAHDLKIADNTYETVEASFQLQTLMRNAAETFKALERLQAPTFEEIFRNEELRREFESLTEKLEVPTS